MLSDGRIIDAPINKVRCDGCGLVRHARPLCAAEVRALYDGDYELPQRTGTGDAARATAYADALQRALGAGTWGRMIDIGCGSGELLRELRRRAQASLYHGIDAALPSAEASYTGDFRLKRAFAEELEDAPERYDTLVSINTIEHSQDAAAFLRHIAALCAPGARIAVVCPAHAPANVELLFYDHLWTLTPRAMAYLARRAGLHLGESRLLDGPLKGFAIYLLALDGDSRVQERDAGDFGDCAGYLERWSQVDTFLTDALQETGGRLQMFGAGQMAALLRAYAPDTFAMVERLVLDSPEEGWPLGLPLESYRSEDHSAGWVSVVAVHPGARDAVKRRIISDGGRPLTLPETIEL